MLDVVSLKILMTIGNNHLLPLFNEEDFPQLTFCLSTKLRYKAFINFRQDITQQTQSGQSQNNH